MAWRGRGFANAGWQARRLNSCRCGCSDEHWDLKGAFADQTISGGTSKSIQPLLWLLPLFLAQGILFAFMPKVQESYEDRYGLKKWCRLQKSPGGWQSSCWNPISWEHRPLHCRSKAAWENWRAAFVFKVWALPIFVFFQRYKEVAAIRHSGTLLCIRQEEGSSWAGGQARHRYWPLVCRVCEVVQHVI